MPKRAILLSGMLVLCIVVLGLGAPSAHGQGVPTNTKRPSVTPTEAARATSTHTLTPTVTLTPSPTLTPTQLGPDRYPDNINPLTGLPYPDEIAKNRRNLIVKVSNYPFVVRPQYGLSFADIVYEYEVEGGVTRFAAIYRSQGAERVGSIRSGRLVDLELAEIYNGMVAYSGFNDGIRNLLKESDLRFQMMSPQFGVNCPPFCRFPSPGVPFEHTLFGNTYQMWEVATKWGANTGYQTRGFAFDETPDAGGIPINDIAIKWYGDQDMRWQYNPTDKKYYRWNSGIPHIDLATGKQLTTDNVIILQAYHVDRPDIYENEAGVITVEILLYGKEKAIVCREGRCYEGVWVRRTKDSRGLALYYEDAQTPIHLKPGQSWVQIVRCCEMYGLTLNPNKVNIQGTETPAAATATARAPKLPPEVITKQAEQIAQTSTASAATMFFIPTATPTP